MNEVLKREHGYTLTEIEDMLPFEREVYTSLLIQHLQEQKNKIQG